MKSYFKLGLILWVPALIALGLYALPPAPSAYAAGPWYVGPGGSDGSSCLSPAARCATINGALNKPGFVASDTIRVAIGTYTGTGVEVVLLNKNAILSGGWNNSFSTQNGMSTIDGQGALRGITVNSGVAAVVERFVIQNGFGSVGGGGILNGGILTMNRSIISNNTADGGASSAVSGGGILNNDNSHLTLNDSLISGNVTNGLGGGIFNGFNSVMTLNNSAVTGNVAGLSWWGGGIYAAGTLTLNNSTVSGNMAGTGGGIYTYQNGVVTIRLNNSTVSNNTANQGGGIYSLDSSFVSVTLRNTIIAGNIGSSGPDCSGPINSSGYNLIANTADCTFTPGSDDLTNISPKLGQLIGSPGYHPLLPGSPAINTGNPTGCIGSTGPLTADQRGVARVGRCDIGAYEYTSPGPATTIAAMGGTPQRTPPSTAFGASLQAVVMDSIGSPVGNATVLFSAPASGLGGTFSGSGATNTTGVSNQSGIATAPTFTANSLTGNYTVTAAVSGVVTPANFLLSNLGWYVTSTGNNANNCQTPATPCATITGTLLKIGFIAGDTVLVAIGTYTGAGDEVALLDKSVRLLGGWNTTFTTQNGTSIIDGQGARRGIMVNSGVTATIEHFRVQGGYVDSGVTPFGGGIFNEGTLTLSSSSISSNIARDGGSGIYNPGTLILNNSIVNSNTITSFNGSGAGISNWGTLTLNNSTINGNLTGTNGVGGGIYNPSNIAVLNNSTISGNTAGGDGGEIYSQGLLTLNSSTVSGNAASSGGGGISVVNSVTLQNTVIAGNTVSNGYPDCYTQFGAFGPAIITSKGYNLIGNTSGCTMSAGPGHLANVNAKLVLTGSPGYHPLLFDSPAINAGNPAGCMGSAGLLTTDQRGLPRFGRCDIGAYEVQPIAFATKTVNKSNALPGDPVTYTITLPNGSPANLTNIRVTDTLPIYLTYINNSLTASGGSYGYNNGVITWTGSVNAGSAVNITFGATVSQTAPFNTSLINSAVISGGNEIVTRAASLNVQARLYLPLVFRNFCPNFFDDFSNPASGWEVTNDSFARSEYLNGEFRILSKQGAYFYFFRAPTCRRQNYVLEADARWAGQPGESYGLIFGITDSPPNFFNQYYLFDMNTDLRQFRLLRRGPSGLVTIVPITFSSAINGGTASNHLKATRNGSQIILELNGTTVATLSDGTITGLTDVGIMSNPYNNIPTSDARFDNFSVVALPGSSATTTPLSGVAVEPGTSQVLGVDHVPVPADMGWSQP